VQPQRLGATRDDQDRNDHQHDAGGEIIGTAGERHQLGPADGKKQPQGAEHDGGEEIEHGEIPLGYEKG